MRNSWIYLAVLICSITFCTGSNNVTPKVPPVVECVNTPMQANKCTCKTACVRMQQLGCEEGESNGLTCEVICLMIIEDRMIELNLACMTNAEDVSQVRKCPGIECIGKESSNKKYRREEKKDDKRVDPYKYSI